MSSLVFRQTYDPYALNVARTLTGRVIASLQWHPERPPRIVITMAWAEFTLDELRDMVEQVQKMVTR